MRALVSVYDKSGVEELARSLVSRGVELISTGGTLAALHAARIPATAVADITGFPEILDGRVKTLHPRIHAGLLARRDDERHLAELAQHEITPIDLVVVNLYPFEATVARPDVTLGAAIEQIDIGGPAMIRAAAKNFSSILVLTDPADYPAALAEIDAGERDPALRRRLAAKAFQHVSTYDSLVAQYLRGDEDMLPDEITLPGRKTHALRYGENPHQAAAAYLVPCVGEPSYGILSARQLGGKELSYNNLLDADAAWRCARSFPRSTCAVVKHTVPCGLASRDDPAAAAAAAIACDPVSAFGGIVALNRPLNAAAARALRDTFLEVVIAPGFEEEALAVLAGKKQLRLLEVPTGAVARPTYREWTLRSIAGGLLVQEADDEPPDESAWRTVTAKAVPAELEPDLRFAWEAVRHLKSNAIAIVNGEALVGIGVGQPNRRDSVRQAVERAAERAVGAVLASDAFFPFADGVEAAAAAGISVIVQPGGSVRDAEVVAAADDAGIAMVFTGRRHFLH